MARTPAQRGRIGAWLVSARLARSYETQAEARREIERLTGWRIPQSQYAEWESGRRVPSESALERLQAFYGAPEPLEATQTPDALLSAVVAALDRQTAAIVAAIGARDQTLEHLLSELGRYRASQLDVLRELQRTGHPEGPMPGDEPEPEPRDPAPMRSGRP